MGLAYTDYFLGWIKMISKLAKAQNSWVSKLIFTAVAVSFVSLFGVTGYITNASQNQTVIDVDGLTTSQSEFSYRLQRELNALKNLADEDFELTDDMRNSLTEGVVRQTADYFQPAGICQSVERAVQPGYFPALSLRGGNERR